MENFEQNIQQKKDKEKQFSNSNLTLENRKKLTITGVEKVFETNENKLQIKVAGNQLCILGESLEVAKLLVNNGEMEVTGIINEIKYLGEIGKGNIFKKLFK